MLIMQQQITPTGRRSVSAGAAKGECYVMGGGTNFGQSGLATFEEYDSATDQWTSAVV